MYIELDPSRVMLVSITRFAPFRTGRASIECPVDRLLGAVKRSQTEFHGLARG
jgi:hypothetical protein